MRVGVNKTDIEMNCGAMDYCLLHDMLHCTKSEEGTTDMLNGSNCTRVYANLVPI